MKSLLAALLFSVAANAQDPLPKLSEALEEAMRQTPQVEAGEARLKSLKMSRVGVLANLVSFNYSKTNTYGNLSGVLNGQSLTLPIDGNNRNNGFSVTVAPAAFFGFGQMGSAVAAGKQSLLSTQQNVGVALIKTWMDFYRLNDTIQTLDYIMKKMDEVAEKVKTGTNPTRDADLQKIIGFKARLQIQVGALNQNLQLAKIDYREIMGRDPVLPAEGGAGYKRAELDEAFKEAKKALDSIFPLPTLDEAKVLVEKSNPDLVAAGFNKKAASTDNWGARIAPILPNITYSTGNILQNGGPPGGLPGGSTINQKSLTFSWSVSPGNATSERSKHYDAVAAAKQQEATRRSVLGGIEKTYITYETVDQAWFSQVERYKAALLALQEIKDPAANVTDALLALQEQLDSWAGADGFAAITTSIITTKAQAHAMMGSLFAQIESLKKIEQGNLQPY
jgi:hypothetical protein